MSPTALKVKMTTGAMKCFPNASMKRESWVSNAARTCVSAIIFGALVLFKHSTTFNSYKLVQSYFKLVGVKVFAQIKHFGRKENVLAISPDVVETGLANVL